MYLKTLLCLCLVSSICMAADSDFIKACTDLADLSNRCDHEKLCPNELRIWTSKCASNLSKFIQSTSFDSHREGAMVDLNTAYLLCFRSNINLDKDQTNDTNYFSLIKDSCKKAADVLAKFQGANIYAINAGIRAAKIEQLEKEGTFAIRGWLEKDNECSKLERTRDLKEVVTDNGKDFLTPSEDACRYKNR